MSKDFPYVSILGTHVSGRQVRVDDKTTVIAGSQDEECGFVVKFYNQNHYSEYSCDNLEETSLLELVEKIKASTKLSAETTKNCVEAGLLQEEKIKKSFSRNPEGKSLSLQEVVEKLKSAKDEIMKTNPLVINGITAYNSMTVSKCFYSTNKELEQYYTWTDVNVVAVVRQENNVKYYYDSISDASEEKCFDKLTSKLPEIVNTAILLLDSKPCTPGIYDVITDPSITGLIAHEAFGHGVEMDMFVKNRALAKDYIGKEIASPLVKMHDGAKSAINVASYFFDDEGVLAQDTVIIKDGILQTGISDCLSALQLDTKSTGNGRRESYKRKAYSRMTNTFFGPGTSTLEEMIKSIDHGYYISTTSNGMEDPKNWGIQCVALYGKEIKDGRFTGAIFSPVVMSGNVPDLLKSISMVSKDFVISGGGFCGKGYKEWVRVSDGGPYLKARVKLG
ncbi:MAG: TldD/PmbA family protein [Erysipelotrichales bacterium]|nr:TldD/PmbA family protein [Erysipelotrichales bacterium]